MVPGANKLGLTRSFPSAISPRPQIWTDSVTMGRGRPKGGIMQRWGIALAAAGLLASGAAAGELKFVPVDTTRNVAAPVNVYSPFGPKKSWLGRVGDSIRSLSPFSSKKSTPTQPGPVMQGAAAGADLAAKAAAVATSATRGSTASAR